MSRTDGTPDPRMSPLSRVQSVTHVSGLDKGENGAGEGIRTLDPDLGKVVLYP